MYPTETPAPLTIEPRSASTIPAITFINVDLPEPLRPTRAILSLGCTTRDMSLNTGLPPNVRATSESCRRGARAIIIS